MGTMNISGQWDETICNMIACQHPPCWESMRRIESGHPHILLKNVVIPGRDYPASEDKLPTLKIVDLPLHYPQSQRVKCVGGSDSSSKTISSSKETRNCFSNSIVNGGWMPPISVYSSERNRFPGLKSRTESQSLRFPPISFTCLSQPEKVQVTGLSEFAVHRLCSQPACGTTVIRWVPDKRPRFLQSQDPNRRVKAPPQKLCVKDLALESLLSVKDHPGTKRKKSNKVPTGGQPYFRHLRRNQKSNNKSSSVGQRRNTDDSLLGTRQQPVPTLPLLLQNEEGVTQGSKRGRALLAIKEQLAAPLIVRKAPSFYRSEAKMKDKDLGRSLGRRMVEQLGDAGDHQDKKGGGLLEHSQMSPESAAGNCKLQASPRMSAKRKSCVKFMDYKSNMARLGMEAPPAEAPMLLSLPAPISSPCPLSQQALPPACWWESPARWRVPFYSFSSTRKKETHPGGCSPLASCLPQASFGYRQYCEHLASWKEATPAERDASDFSREAWPEEEDFQEAPKTFAQLQPPGPPPPSPSPSLFENSPNSPLGFT